MTLAQIIDAYEQRRAIDFVPSAAGLTPQGHAAVAGYRFIKALRELPPHDRAEALAIFAAELRDVIAELAVS